MPRASRRTLRVALGVAAVAMSSIFLRPYENPWTSWCYALLVTAGVACFKAFTLHLRYPNPERVARLARAIHERASELIMDGYTQLCPPDVDTQTAYIRLDMTGTTVNVYRVDWDVYHGRAPFRKFEIGPEGQVARRSYDRYWRCASLIHQLESLTADLHYVYAPRRAMKVHREDH